MDASAQILEVTSRFTDAVNRQDANQFEAVWTPQATWRIDPPSDLVLEGGAGEIAEAFAAGMSANWEWFIQLLHGTVVDVDGSAASARTYVSERAQSRSGDGYANVGVYLDKLEEIDGAWRFKERHYRYLYLDSSPVAGQGFPFPAA